MSIRRTGGVVRQAGFIDFCWERPLHLVERSSSDSIAEPQELEDLLARVGRGDTSAFGEVYTAVAGSVLGLVHGVLADAAQAEEVCQEVLVEVWRRASRFDPVRGSARAWIMTMAHRRAVERIRSARASGDIEHDEAGGDAGLFRDDARVRGCLDALSPAQREPLLLAYFHGRTYRECAERTGLALGTVKTRMRDGLIRLRDLPLPV